MGRSKKDKFQDLDQDFQDTVAGMNEAEIRNKIASVALNQVAVSTAKELDEDLAQKKEAAKVAGEGYAEATKMNKLRIEFCRRVLSDKGKDVGESGFEE